MIRYHDWQLRFEAFVRERWARPFAWGSNDCVLFAADSVQALTGQRLCPELRIHTGVRDGLQLLRALGGVRAIASRALGSEIPAVRALVGDVVVVPTGKREALAVCNGGTAIFPGPQGIEPVSMRLARAAWRVG